MKTKPILLAPALSGILFISVCALLPSPAQAQCKRWDVSGQWVILLDKKEEVQVNLQQGNAQQTSANFTGTGERIATDGGKFDKPQKGVISGNITDNSFAMLLTVRTDQHRFQGTIGPNGTMEGICTTDRNTHWVSSRKMKCADAAAINPSAPATTGKVTSPTPTPAADAANDQSSKDTEERHKNHKKNKKKHRQNQDDDNQEQSSD